MIVTKNKYNTRMNPSNYYSKGLLAALTADGAMQKYQDVLKSLKVNINGKESALYNLAQTIMQVNIDLTEVQGDSQDAQIAKNIMPAVNYILHTLQSFIVSSKQTINTVSSAIFSTKAKLQFDFSNGESLEIMRKKLLSETISISDVAKLFQISDGSLQLKEEIAFDGFENKFDAIKAALIKEIGNDASKLRALQENKNNWYDFEFLNNTNYKKTVEIFKSVMQYLTETLISAISILKDVVNYAYSYYKQDPEVKLCEKSAAELVSDLNRTRSSNPLDWAKNVRIVKEQQVMQI